MSACHFNSNHFFMMQDKSFNNLRDKNTLECGHFNFVYRVKHCWKCKNVYHLSIWSHNCVVNKMICEFDGVPRYWIVDSNRCQEAVMKTEISTKQLPFHSITSINRYMHFATIILYITLINCHICWKMFMKSICLANWAERSLATVTDTGIIVGNAA